MNTYILKRLPDNLKRVLDTLDPGAANIVYYGYEDEYGYVLELNESLIPDRSLTAVWLMITPLLLKDPAVGSNDILNQMYPHVIKSYQELFDAHQNKDAETPR
jgi:hypothetical protein